MTRQDKARRILAILDRLYPSVDIPLDHVDPFTLLVAVVLSAQTTDRLVNEVTPALFGRASTPEAMAMLPVEEIQHLIRRIGLTASKAKNLKRLSEILVAEHIYRIAEIVGTSPNGVDDAIRNAVARANQTLRNIDWFEMKEVRGHLADGQVADWQVTVKIGFRLDDSA